MSLAVESSRDWRGDLWDMARIAMPIVFINLGIQAMGVVDALMVGKLGGAAIAAGAAFAEARDKEAIVLALAGLATLKLR